MENLSDLDDCINTLEKLQLTLDFETSTVKRNPKDQKAVELIDHNHFRSSPNRVDLVHSNQHRSDRFVYDSNLPDITKSSIVYKNQINSDPYLLENKRIMQVSAESTDFKSLSVRRPKLTSNLSVDAELFSVPECDATDFPAPPPLISPDGDHYVKNYSNYTMPRQQSLTSSNCTTSGNVSFHSSSRKHSTNSLKLSPKTTVDPFYPSHNNAVNSSHSSQSNISHLTEKESKEAKSFPNVETMTEMVDHSKPTVVRFFSADKTTKALFIKEKMRVEAVIKVLMEKNFWIPSLKSAIVEKVPSLKMERFFEEHEFLLDCVNSWPATCSNMIFFEQRDDIYGLFENAKSYLGDNYPLGAMNVDAIKSMFYNLTTGQHEFQDYIYIKKPAENTWKRKFCLLNQDGITTIHRRNPRPAKNQSNVMTFNDRYLLYTTTGGWTKEWNAPTPFGFAFKPYSVVDPKSEELLMLCASDETSMKRWCSNLRLCKYKNQILNNYQQMQTRSTYCSNLYSSDDHHFNRTASLSPAVYSRHPNVNYNSRCSLPTSSHEGSQTHPSKFKF